MRREPHGMYRLISGRALFALFCASNGGASIDLTDVSESGATSAS